MPVLDRPLVVLVALAYLAAVFGIGIWAAARTRTARDFFIADQRLGLLVAALATMATAFSGFVFLGGPGLTYRIGLGSLWIVLPVGFTAGLLCWVVGRPLRLMAGVREIYTVPDAVGCRWPGSWPAGLAALAVTLGTTAYLAAQLLALGVLLRAVFGVQDLRLALVVGALIMLGYCTFGGMIAGVYTDVLQGSLMVLAAGATFVQALHVCGGARAMLASIADSPLFGASFLHPLGRIEPVTAFGLYFVFGVGVLGQPHLLHKFFMVREPRMLKWFPALLGSSQVLCLLVWVGIGLAVPALVAQGRLAPLPRPDDAAPAFLLGFAPEPLAGLFLTGALSAIMSTADSLMNVGAAALTRDLPRALGRPLRRELAWGRLAVVAITLAAAGLAWAHGSLIALLGTLAFGTFGAALAPALAVGLNWTRVTGVAAAASIGTGLVASVALELLARRDQGVWPELDFAPGVPPAALALGASFSVLFLVTWLSRPDGVIVDAGEAKGRP